MKKLLEQLSKIFGYEVPECQSPDLYFQLMALQVGTLSNPEAQGQLKSIEAITILAKICKIILENELQALKILLKATNEDQSKATSKNTKRKCNCSKLSRTRENYDRGR